MWRSAAIPDRRHCKDVFEPDRDLVVGPQHAGIGHDNLDKPSLKEPR